MKPSTSPPKPTKPIWLILNQVWFLWLFYRLLAYPLLVGFSLSSMGQALMGVVWQFFVLLPALLLTPAIKKGNSPYALIVASLVMLVYLGAVGVFLLMRLYENAPLPISIGFAIETLLLLAINALLFVLLKRLPPMHKNPPRGRSDDL